MQVQVCIMSSWSRFPNQQTACVERENRRQICEWAEPELHELQSLLRVVLLSTVSCLSASKSDPAACCCPPSLHLPPKPKRFPSYQRPTAAANTDKGRPLKRSHLLILSQHCALWANRRLSLICAAVDFRESHTETHGLESDTGSREDCVNLDPEIPSRLLIKRSIKESRVNFISCQARGF